MPTRKRSKRKPEQLKKKADTPEMKVVKEEPGPEIKSDFTDVAVKQDEPKPIQEVKESKQEYIKRHTSLPKEITDFKSVPPHYISERIIGNDQLGDIANTFNKRFKAGYRFKTLIPLRGNESIAIYEKIMTIEIKNPKESMVFGSSGPDDTVLKGFQP